MTSCLPTPVVKAGGRTDGVGDFASWITPMDPKQPPTAPETSRRNA